MCFLAGLCSSVASFTLWASPRKGGSRLTEADVPKPNVIECGYYSVDCPVVLEEGARLLTVISRTSWMVFPFHSTSSVSLVYLLPLQTSHVTQTSGRKFISSFVDPAPWHASHLPPLTLKENWPGSYPLSLARGSMRIVA